MSSHHYLEFVDVPADQKLVRRIASTLMNLYFNQNLTYKRWLKQQPAVANHWSQGANNVRTWSTSKPVSVKALEKHIATTRSFDAKLFNLFDPRCNWLDASIVGSPSFQGLPLQVPTTLGASFPLVPTLEREGTFFNSFQLLLLNRICELRETLVTGSDKFADEHWFQDLRSFISESVSLVDVTLHQIYFKAQYSPLPGWTFDPDTLGPRHGRNVKDKLSWIFQITGRPLHARDELEAFFEIKDLRNHLQHFDPPCFCFTMEDAAKWINTMHHLAELCWRIRDCISSPLCVPLIRMLLAPNVRFVPKGARHRPAQPQGSGYDSTRWRSPPVKDDSAVRFNPNESTRLDELMTQFPGATRRDVARVALRLGIEALERSPNTKPTTEW